MVSPETVLTARRWADLGLPHDQAGLRVAQRAVHPDMCSEAGAADAFMRLKSLFNAPDVDLRIATGTYGSGAVTWAFGDADADLAEVAWSAHRDIRATDGLWAAEATLNSDHTTLTCDYGPGWWWLSDFGVLDERTVVWVAKRLMALAAIAAKHNVVHGDIHPATVALLPAGHGLRLDGWWTGVRVGLPLAVRPVAPTLGRFTKGAPATPELMVSQSAKMLLDHEAGPLTKTLNDLWLRPTGPDAAFHTIDRIAHDAFGKPTWHPLAAPTTKGI